MINQRFFPKNLCESGSSILGEAERNSQKPEGFAVDVCVSVVSNNSPW